MRGEESPSGEFSMAETAAFFKENGHLNETGVALYVDALKLDTVDQVPEEVRRHVEECTECKTNITGVFALLQEENYGVLSDHPTFRLGKRRSLQGIPMILRIAAIVAGIGLVVALAYYLLPMGGGEAKTGGQASTAGVAQDSAVSLQRGPEVPAHRQTGELAANFTPNPDFEGLAAGGMRSEELTGVVPPNGASVRPLMIRFDWHSKKDRALALIVYDNRGKVVYSVSHTKPPVEIQGALKPGLYYWKLMNEDEALNFGKFYARQ
jgi:hypothetical protein